METLANGHSVRTELGIQGTGGLLPNNGLALRDIATGDAIGPGCPEATASFVKNVRSLGCTAGPVRLTTAPPNQPETGTYSFSFSCEGGRNQLVRALGELTREFLTALGF